MFARYFVELPIEPKLVERALTDAPAHWLRGLASDANHRGDTLLADVGFGGRVRVARQVALELGPPVHTAGKTVLPMRWTPTGATGLFPALEADLEVAPLASDRTQLAMSARYVPPLGPIGHAIDRAILYRIAEATLKDFLDRVGDALVLGAETDIEERRDVPSVAD
ncbi:MAG: hypothetical protein ABI595_07480 [Actinomycetota bacterium]